MNASTFDEREIFKRFTNTVVESLQEPCFLLQSMEFVTYRLTIEDHSIISQACGRKVKTKFCKSAATSSKFEKFGNKFSGTKAVSIAHMKCSFF